MSATLFALVIFQIGSHHFCPASKNILLISTFVVAGMISMNHSTHQNLPPFFVIVAKFSQI
jgi:hypothetical protein